MCLPAESLPDIQYVIYARVRAETSECCPHSAHSAEDRPGRRRDFRDRPGIRRLPQTFHRLPARKGGSIFPDHSAFLSESILSQKSMIEKRKVCLFRLTSFLCRTDGKPGRRYDFTASRDTVLNVRRLRAHSTRAVRRVPKRKRRLG